MCFLHAKIHASVYNSSGVSLEGACWGHVICLHCMGAGSYLVLQPAGITSCVCIACRQALVWCCRSTEQDVITVVAAADATTLFLGALYSLDVLPIISVERAIFYRERSAFFYHSLPFSLAQCTVELPYIFVQAYVYTCIIYWCCGFEADAGKTLHIL